MKIKIKKPTPISVSIKTTQVQPELEDLEITPSTEEQNFKSNKYGYNNVKVKAVEGENLEITASTEEQNFSGFFTNVNVSGFDGVNTSDATVTPADILKDKTAYANNEKIIGTIENYDGSYSGNTAEVFKITDAGYLFFNSSRINNLNEVLLLCENVTVTRYMFNGCNSLTSLNLSNFNTSNVTNMEYMFSSCNKLTSLNLSGFDTSNVTNMNQMFSYLITLTDLDLTNFDMSKVQNISYMFRGSSKLANLKSFKNLGKGYDMKLENSSDYRLTLADCTNLTHESLVDILTNGLYDLNLAYNVANGETLYRQSVVLGSTNLAKLEATEEGQLALAEADRKGWNVS